VPVWAAKYHHLSRRLVLAHQGPKSNIGAGSPAALSQAHYPWVRPDAHQRTPPPARNATFMMIDASMSACCRLRVVPISTGKAKKLPGRRRGRERGEGSAGRHHVCVQDFARTRACKWMLRCVDECLFARVHACAGGRV
jgi:hypothetical protein